MGNIEDPNYEILLSCLSLELLDLGNSPDFLDLSVSRKRFSEFSGILLAIFLGL